MKSDTDWVQGPMVPMLYQYAFYEAFVRSVRLYVAYGVVTGYIRVV